MTAPESSELDATLNRRKQLAEADGAVFETTAQETVADMVWHRHEQGQFSPRGRSHRNGHRGITKEVPLNVVERPCLSEAAETTDMFGSDPVAGVPSEPPCLALVPGPTADEPPEPPCLALEQPDWKAQPATLQEAGPTAVHASPLLEEAGAADLTRRPQRVTSPAKSMAEAGIDYQSVRAEDLEARLLELGRSRSCSRSRSRGDSVCASGGSDAHVVTDDVPPTAPASTAAPGSPTDQKAATPPWAVPPMIDLPVSGENSTCSPHVQNQPPTPEFFIGSRPATGNQEIETVRCLTAGNQNSPVKPSSPVALTHRAFEPFPRPRASVLQDKLRDVLDDAEAIKRRVQEAMASTHIYPEELDSIVRDAGVLQKRFQLGDTDSEPAGWPTLALRQMRYAAEGLDRWRKSDEAAREAVALGSASVTNADGNSAAVDKTQQSAAPNLARALWALHQLLTSWIELSAVAQGPMRTVCGLDRKAKGALPLVSALLDQAIALFRQSSDMLAAQRMEMILKQGAAQRALQEIGVAALLQQSLQELAECVRIVAVSNYNLTVVAPPLCSAYPDVFWRAITDGDVRTVASVIQQGGLVSGRTRDPQGHSVFWDACALGVASVAILLITSFPPGSPQGVDLGETHPRNGKSLLHSVAGIQPFLSEEASLFDMIFDRMPEALQLHSARNKQTFLHIAASRANFHVLRLAASRGLLDAFAEKDDAGWSPLLLLNQQMASLRIAEQTPPPHSLGTACMPSWFPLGQLMPNMTEEGNGKGEGLPADMTLNVVDESLGTVIIPAHRFIVAVGSPVWHKAIQGAEHASKNSDGSKLAPIVLPLDSGLCRHADIIRCVIRFFYTGAVVDCPFLDDGPKLLQLLRLCSALSLADPLRRWAEDALFANLRNGAGLEVILPTLSEGTSLKLKKDRILFVSRCLLRHGDEWKGTNSMSTKTSETRQRPLDLALEAVQAAFVQAHRSTRARAEATASPNGASLGSGWMKHSWNLEDPRSLHGAPQVRPVASASFE